MQDNIFCPSPLKNLKGTSIRSLVAGEDPAILKRGVPTICPHLNALIVQKKKGVPTPEPSPWIRHWVDRCIPYLCFITHVDFLL